MPNIYQKRWYDIDFGVFYTLDTKSVVGKDFYKHFYHAFYKKYSSFSDLPSSYLQQKKAISSHLAECIAEKKANVVLSFGCGNGVVEKNLLNLLPNLKLHAYEPDEINLTWLKQIPGIHLSHGDFPQCLPLQKYDLIYLSGIDCLLPDDYYVSLLATLRKLTPGPVILTSVIKPYANLLSYPKYWLKRLLATVGMYSLGQLMGVARHIHEHEILFKKAGYHMVAKGDLCQGLMWIEISPINLE